MKGWREEDVYTPFICKNHVYRLRLACKTPPYSKIMSVLFTLRASAKRCAPSAMM